MAASIAFVLALALGAAACGSGDDANDATDAAADSDAAASGDDVSTDGTNGTDGTVDGADGTVDPNSISQLAGSLTGSTIEGEPLACLVADADGDSQLTGLYQGIGTAGYQITPEGFTALAVSVHGCVEDTVLATSLIPISGAVSGDEATSFTQCVASEITSEPNGDLAYTGLSALLVGFDVPEGAQDQTVLAARNCVDAPMVANQLAATREQIASYDIVVDRDCVAAEIEGDFLDSFWDGVIRATEDPTVELEPVLDGCSEEYDSGLPKEIPADFAPWSGTGVLAGVDPASRNGAYDSAPPNQLVDGVDYQAVFTTADGDIVIDLYEDTAPITVNAFVSLARDGFYDMTVFHRVLNGFMAQGGDPTGTGTGGPGYAFDDEESAMTAVDRRGLLAMANSGADSNGSQFFITFDAATHLDGLHAVFGEVIEGDDVLAQIDLRDPQAPTSRGEQLISVVITES